MSVSFQISLLGVRSFVVAAMENNHDQDNISESSSGEADQKVEALDLLEESWFFENLFNRRRMMLRCYSDPCTSSNFSQGVLAKDSFSQTQSSKSTKKFQDKGSAHCCSLIRAPSLPPCIGREQEKVQERKSKLNRQLSLQASRTTCTEKIHEIQEKKTDKKSKLSSGESLRSNLLRAPSLPTSIGRKELIQDNDSDIRMSKLIRQALANSPDILPPRHSPNKAMTQSCSLQRCRPPRNLEVETINNTKAYSNQKKILQKSHSDLAFQELQGFKDLGFTFDKEDLSPGVVNILPGLQENKIEDLKQDKVIRKPYLSEAWLVQSRATPPIPTCVSKNSTEDMKAQLKFWARAVATNVRQEC